MNTNRKKPIKALEAAIAERRAAMQLEKRELTAEEIEWGQSLVGLNWAARADAWVERARSMGRSDGDILG